MIKAILKTTNKRLQTDITLKNNYLIKINYIGNKRHFVY